MKKLITQYQKQQNEDYKEKIRQLHTQYEKQESESKMKLEWMENKNAELEKLSMNMKRKYQIQQNNYLNKTKAIQEEAIINRLLTLRHIKLKMNLMNRKTYFKVDQRKPQRRLQNINRKKIRDIKTLSSIVIMNKTNKDLNETKAFYEQKILEQDTINQNIQFQLKQASDQEFYEKMNQILQENEELRQLRSENQEELTQKDLMIEELKINRKFRLIRKKKKTRIVGQSKEDNLRSKDPQMIN
ncbi:unnamed protein product [Paramecium octaurelia]|uniref:Uncharacterized protein n=1 Tax=Paramecium octaurelia TaxID=43137 RepID=A0A8S1TR18_PAROT|nr:unnamed protein product [Paramecium octaurelia]